MTLNGLSLAQVTATVQKRIRVIEFLRLRLIIVYQDSQLNLKNPPDGGFFDLQIIGDFVNIF